MNKRTVLLGVLLAIGLIAALSPAQQRESPPVKLKMISPDLYEVLDGSGARGGAYIGDKAVLLIDAKMDQRSVNQTLAAIKELTNKPVKYLVNTHSDGDHVRGNQFFPETITFIAHENCRKEFFHPGRDGTPSEWNKPELAPFVPSITFRDKMDVYLGSKKIELWYFGVGHTTGDIVLYFPKEKAAFIGDQVFVTRPQLIHSYKGGNSFEHVKTLSRMLDTLDADRFFSGHEEMLDRAAIRRHIDEMTAMQGKVKALVGQGKSIDDIKGQFKENEARLVEAIHQDLTTAKARGDTYLPWEGGAAYYAKWSNGPPAEPGFFPISVWLQSPATAPQYKAIGINQFIGLWKGPTDEQLQTLAAAGMPVFAAQRPAIVQSAHSGSIRGWTLMDEPDNAQPKPGGGYGPCVLPPLIIEQYEKLKAADPTRPVYLNLGQAVINDAWVGRGEVCGRHTEHYAEYIRGTDIVSYDVYPVNGNLPLWYVGAGIDRLRKWANYQKPVWNWIETTAIRSGPRPAPQQIRAEVWMSIVHGSMGIGYFCHQFKPAFDESGPLHDAATRQALAAINEQITSLAPVLNTPPVANGVSVASSNADSPIDVLLKRHGGATYLFAMGARPGGKTVARFKLRDCGNLVATVLGESRTIPVKGGVFQDDFADYEVHLYKLPFAPKPK